MTATDQSSQVCDLTAKHCKPCEGGVPALGPDEVSKLLKQVSGWTCAGNELSKTYQFKNYYQTMAFVNAVAWIANAENHHPDLEVGYNKCRVRYSTHAVGGLTENDFICAAKVDALLAE